MSRENSINHNDKVALENSTKIFNTFKVILDEE